MQGEFRSVFTSDAPDAESQGHNAVPVPGSGGGLELSVENGHAAYEFPVDIVSARKRIIVELNVAENFRWLDQVLPGYARGTFDTTVSAYEPVIAFGANRVDVLTE